MTQIDAQRLAAGQDDDTNPTVTPVPPTRRSGGRGMWMAAGGELLGSFLVCFAIYTAYVFGTPLYGTNLAFIAIATGVAYGVVTLVFSAFSKVQLNPAVTLAAVLGSRTRPLDGLLYVVAQLIGALAAGALFRGLLPLSQTLTSKLWLAFAVNGFDKGSVSATALNGAGAHFGIMIAIVVELVASLIIVAMFMRGTDDEDGSTQRYAAGMGLAYGLGAAITFPVSGAALNPARATGIAVFAQGQGLGAEPLVQLWVFWVAPVLAAAIVSLVVVGREIVSGGRIETESHDDGEDVKVYDSEDPQAYAGMVAGVDDQYDAQGYEAQRNGAEMSSGEQMDAEVEQQQSQTESDANEGVETH